MPKDDFTTLDSYTVEVQRKVEEDSESTLHRVVISGDGLAEPLVIPAPEPGEAIRQVGTVLDQRRQGITVS